MIALWLSGCRAPDVVPTPTTTSLPTVGAVSLAPAAPQPGATGDTGRPVEDVLLEGFLWGYPLVFSARLLADKPYDTFVWHDGRPNETLDHVPNPDVIYGIASVDLRAEPAVLHTTDLLDRYWSVQLADPYVESVTYVGTRATGGLGGDWLVVGPGFAGDPLGLPILRMTTDRVAVLARLHVRSDADLPAVLALRDGISIEPWSAFLGTEPPPIPALPTVLGAHDDTGTNGLSFWDELGDALAASGARADEADVPAALAAFGVGPGRHPSEELTDPAMREALLRATEDGLAAIASEVDTYKHWVPELNAGNFHRDFLHRAAWCSDGWVTHTPEEGVYVRSPLLAGDGSYTLRFEADQLPPVDAFWSLAVYVEDGHLVANPFDRFSLQSTDPEVGWGADGSLEIHLSPTNPGGPPANWLPVNPTVPFSAMLRAYLPGQAVRDGAWSPPPIVPTGRR